MAQWYETFASASSAGILPNKTSARALRYRKSIFWNVDLLSIGANGSIKKGEWTVTISSADESQIYFKHKVTLELMLVSIGTIGLQLFTWFYVKDSFQTEIIAGQPVTKETIGEFLQGGTAASEQGDMRPASGIDSTNLTATIIADWYSPIYLFDRMNLPVGAKVKISRDTWGIGTANSTYQWAFEEGVASIGTTIDELGALVSARNAPDGQRIFTGRAWPGSDYQFLEPGGAVKGSFPTILELSNGNQIMTLQTAEGVIEVESQNSEWTWNRVQYVDSETGAKSIQAVFGPSMTMPKSILLPDDSRVILVESGSSLYSRTVTKGELQEQVFVGAKPESYSIEKGHDQTLYIIGPSGKPVYKSLSEPVRWQPAVEADPATVDSEVVTA